MKKLLSILLLGTFLMNLGGYNLLFSYFIHQSDVQMVKQMYDNKFNSAKLLEIKVPVNMPTIQDWTEYENIPGQIQFNGGYYNYVRLKMTRDTMYVVCLPNNVKTHLVNANIIVAKNINDVPLSKKGAEPASKKADFGYDNVYQILKCDYTAFEEPASVISNTLALRLTNPYIESPGKPPNASC